MDIIHAHAHDYLDFNQSSIITCIDSLCPIPAVGENNYFDYFKDKYLMFTSYMCIYSIFICIYIDKYLRVCVCVYV